MDSEDLLARENEFKKLNKQLEKKTESLMKEIEHVMQKQDIFSEFSNLTVESVCKFLSAKVKLMQEQIDKLQATIDKKAKQCEKHMTHLAELESERLTLLNRANSMRAEAADAKAKYAAIQNRLAEKDRLYKERRSVTDKLTNEQKQLKCKNTSLEARCASQDESISTLKQQLEVAKMTEKEFRDSTRALSASHQTTIQRLETRIKTLTLRTDRQTALIDNLKKQNALLQTDGAVKALEKEYCEFLKQDF